MRMRKKKNCDARMECCSDIWIKEPEKYKGKWAERFGNDNPIHIEIIFVRCLRCIQKLHG